MQKYKIELPKNDNEVSEHLVSALVSEEEADLVTDPRYVKFVVSPSAEQLHGELGEKAADADVTASIARIIHFVYLSMQADDPTGAQAEIFRETMELAIEDPSFWEKNKTKKNEQQGRK
jgi:hypothetical protein